MVIITVSTHLFLAHTPPGKLLIFVNVSEANADNIKFNNSEVLARIDKYGERERLKQLKYKR